MKGILSFLQAEMETPTSYGWFHFLFLALVVVATVLLSVFFKDCKDKTFRRIALIAWIIMVAFEVYKQIVFTFKVVDGEIVGDYQWYAFPYQFCSTPMYILPFVAFMKEGKARDFFTSYISTFAMFGGLVVFAYPNDVFIETIGVNIQTMIHHGLQIVTGVFFAVYERKKLTLPYFAKSIAVFAVTSAIAIGLNEMMYYIFQAKGIDETFNMFYISSHFPAHLPVLSTVYEIAPYPVFLIAYLVGFTLASALVFYVIVGIMKLVKKKANDKI